MSRLGSGIRLVGRDEELSRLDAALEQARAGTAGAVLLSGDAGIGKSRLLDELTGKARASGAIVLSGQCVDIGGGTLPYLPFVEIISQLPADLLASAHNRPALSRLIPSLTASHPGPGAASDPEMGQLQLFDAVLSLLTEVTVDTPVLLILEDLHWADRSTRDLLAFLLIRLRTQRLLVAGSYRSDEMTRQHPLQALLAELVRRPNVDRIHLEPLDQTDSRSLVDALAWDRLPDAVLDRIARRSEGNAFFAEELLAASESSGDRVPTALADVLLARLERLGGAAQRVVRVASVGRRKVGYLTMRAVTELPEAELNDALREAVTHHILVPKEGADADAFTFRHALLQEAAYADLLPGERARLHASYARVMAGWPNRRGTAASIAHHSLQSNDVNQALPALVRAAEEVTEFHAPAEALGYLEQALTLWHSVPDADERTGADELELMRRAAYAANAAGEQSRAIAHARGAVSLAEANGDPMRIANNLERLAEYYLIGGHYEEARASAARAWELVSDLPSNEITVWVEATLARAYLNLDLHEQSAAHAEHAMGVARELGSGASEADALMSLAISTGPAETDLELFEKACARAAEAGAIGVELRARNNLAILHFERGSFADAVRVVDDAVHWLGEVGLTWSHYGQKLRFMQALVHYSIGDWDGAEAALAGDDAPAEAATNAASAKLLVVIGRGRFEEADQILAVLPSEPSADHWMNDFVASARVKMALWRGDPRLAVDVAERYWEAFRAASTVVAWDTVGLVAQGVTAYADLADQARSVRDETAELAAIEAGTRMAASVDVLLKEPRPPRSNNTRELDGWSAWIDAEVGRMRGKDDPELWRRTVDAFDYGPVYEQALARWRRAAALLKHDDRSGAETELRAAYATADRLGAKPLRDAILSLASRGRLTVTDDAADQVSTVDPFTPRERSVLELVAQGMTNREAGERLFISEKTVSVHLSRVMSKLDAGSRTEAVSVAYARGLLG